MPQIHLQEISISFSWPELQVSAVSLRFLLFFHNFSTSRICFSCSVGIKFHIKIALLLERCQKRICIYTTSPVIMQFSCEFSFPCPIRSIFCYVLPGEQCSKKWWTQTEAPPNGRLQLLKNIKNPYWNTWNICWNRQKTFENRQETFETCQKTSENHQNNFWLEIHSRALAVQSDMKDQLLGKSCLA